MNVQIVVRHMKVSKRITRLVKEMAIELANTFDGLSEIQIVLEDINGPTKDGIDKRCHLRLRGSRRLGIDIEKVAEDVTQSVDLAFLQLRTKLRRIRDRRKLQHHTCHQDWFHQGFPMWEYMA